MDDYIIYTEIGSGTDSVVFKGRKSGTLEYIALQSFEFRLSEKAAAKFLNGSDLVHPNVLRVMKMSDTSSRRWLVMEYCPGGDLLSLLATDIRLDVPVVRQFALDLSSGLQYCHTKGLVVRDLRPAKILIDNGWLKLGDLSTGLKLSPLGDVHTDRQGWYPESDEVAALYQAPEVVKFGAPRAATMLSDLWSLGCIIYEMFAGSPPFVSDDINALHELITEGAMPLEPLDTAPPELIALVEGLVCASPTTRMRWQRLCASAFFTAGDDDGGESGALECLPTPATDAHADHMLRDVDIGGARDLIGKPLMPVVFTPPASAQPVIAKQPHRYTTHATGRDAPSTPARTKAMDPHALLTAVAARRQPPGASPPARRRTSDTNDGADTAADAPRSAATVHAHGSEAPVSVASPWVPKHSSVDAVEPVCEQVSGSSRLQTAVSARHSQQHTLKRESIVLATDVQIDDLVFHESDGMISALVANPKIEKCSVVKYTGKYGTLKTVAPNRWVAMDIDSLRQHLIRTDQCIAEGSLARDTVCGSFHRRCRMLPVLTCIRSHRGFFSVAVTVHDGLCVSMCVRVYIYVCTCVYMCVTK